MILLAATQGVASDAYRNVVIGVCVTVVTGIIAYLGRKAARLIDRISNVIEEVEPKKTRIDYTTDPDTGEKKPIVVERGRPGVQGQIADLRGALDEVRDGLKLAVEHMAVLAHIPEQLAENRQHIEGRLADAERLQREMLALAADAARDAANADQRVAELAELVGAQIEALHEENQGLRAALHELGIDTEIPKP